MIVEGTLGRSDRLAHHLARQSKVTRDRLDGLAAGVLAPDPNHCLHHQHPDLAAWSNQAAAYAIEMRGPSWTPITPLRGSLLRADPHDGGFNDVSASALVGLEWRRGRDRWSPSVGFTQRWYGGDAYARTLSPTLDWLHPLRRQAQLVVHGGAAKSDYIHNDLQDGALFDVAVGYERAASARSGYGLTLFGYRQTARDPGYATVSGGVALSAWQDIGRTTFLVTTGVSRLEGDERLFLFPERRREWSVNSSVSATLRQWVVRGFAPTLRLAVERNTSSVGLYTFRRIAGEIGLARAF